MVPHDKESRRWSTTIVCRNSTTFTSALLVSSVFYQYVRVALRDKFWLHLFVPDLFWTIFSRLNVAEISLDSIYLFLRFVVLP